jgi:hypothetical protein
MDMARRTVRLAILVGAASWVLVSSASAAVAFRIATEPPEPRVGEPTRIVVKTFEYVSPPEVPSRPLALDDFAWTFVAEAPSGGKHVIELERSGTSGNEWTATFEFDEAGSWEVGLDRTHLGTPADPSIGARMTVAVRADGDTTPVAATIAAAAVLLLAGLVMAARYRSARRSSAGGATGEGISSVRR